jgi:flagellar M-ring protein FliF
VSRFLESLKALGGLRLAGIAVVGLLVLGIVGGIVMRGGTQPMALLFGDLDLRESGQVTASLDKIRVPYELRAGGTQILVPSDQVDRMRLAMARDGIPAGGSVGYEVFDRSDSLTSNQFQQQMNQLRALEGELGRTIRTIRSVRAARVHLVMAKREPFAREQQDAQASIILSVTGGRRMDDGEVQAVVNLVAGAVPGLKPQNVTVVDDRGQSLTRTAHGRDAATSAGDDARRLVEQRLGQAVEDMLGRTVGAGHVRAEATVEMNFEHSSETQERFDPDDQVVRTQQSTTDASKTSEPQQGVSVQNNLPNPDVQAAGGAGTSSNRQEENMTYEIGKTVRTVVRDAPAIKRVSMAVLVDGITSRGPDGKSTWREMPQADLDHLVVLVKSAVGFDEKRGDRVDVVSMRFSSPDDAFETEPAAAPWLQLGKADLIWLATLGIVAVVALFALGFVVRPLALKLAANLPAPVRALAGPAAQPVGLSAPEGGALTAEQALQLADTSDKDTMLNMANIQGEVRALSIRHLGELVETQPEAAVSVVRGWLAQKAT